ncbi:uncharacterized protein LOC122065118 [Macadamia integrifolia]|uniref:uncharacterized protein LOC122065118 n=1 Tax=Macadamia integrifolia TaxID=60698 RepID=UPI001C4F3120|nr:uncharacterized protein LOC122065118 [Macadamia integrifolia]
MHSALGGVSCFIFGPYHFMLLPCLAAKLIRLPQFDMDDQCFWSGSSSGAFSTFSSWNEIRRRNPKVPWFPLVWSKALQLRQFVFGWRLMHKKIPTDDIISHKGIPLVSKCNLCGLDVESFNHIFISCSFSVALWKQFMDCFGILWLDPSDLHQLSLWSIRKRRILSVKDPWSVGFVVVADNIWRERNERRHDGPSRSVSHVFEKIKCDVQDGKFNLQGMIK